MGVSESVHLSFTMCIKGHSRLGFCRFFGLQGSTRCVGFTYWNLGVGVRKALSRGGLGLLDERSQT